MKKFGTGLAVLIILALIIYALGGFNKVADVVEDTVDVVADTADAVEDAVEDAMDDADDMDEVIEEEVIEEDDMDDADEWEANIVTTAIDSGEFPTLVAAVQAAWLVDTLADGGPFTVFAPTEEAFAALLAEVDMTAEELLSDIELLTKVLTYHVVPWVYTASDVLALTGTLAATTAEWSIVMIDANDWSPTVNTSNIVMTDITASNGIIHAIDTVLMPE